MGTTRLTLYILGLGLVVAAAWVFLTQTPVADDLPAGVALAILLLLVGIGVMVSANAIDDRTVRRRVVHDGDAYARGRYETYDPPSSETVVEERRF